MQTKLIEFKNHNNETLRGIVAAPDGSPKGAAIFLHGFERNASVEKKFRRLADALAKLGIASLRFDASGCGLSDGVFADTTIAKRTREIFAAVDYFKKEVGVKKISFVAHSLGGCVLASKLDELKPVIGKIVLIAPALNQKDLLRFYFARDTIKANDPRINIYWNNYKQYLSEEKFLADCQKTGRMLKENIIGPDYFMEAKDLDFSRKFNGTENNILHIHGDSDPKVPFESIGVVFPNRVLVKGGDHNLERPDFWEQWFNQVVDFLCK